MPLAPRTRLGPYEVISLLGTGGMGEVYKARDTRLSREVAVKVLPARLAQRSEAMARFKQEAQVIATLSHPNILSLYDFGEDKGVVYAVTELLAGETLQDQLDKGAMPIRKALDRAVQMAAGLAAAHEKGIVHRDIKPGNVFITSDGRVKLLDFGLAFWKGETTGSGDDLSTLDRRTTPGTVLGTIGYMSPEQARGQRVDHRSDIFSLGVVLYEMISGQKAFVRDTSADSLSAVLNHDPPEPSRLRPSVPPSLDRLVRRCLEKAPEERFQSARDLAFAVQAISDADMGKSADSVREEAPSVAVLPFVNMSPDPEQEYFCEGIAEEIINALTRLENVRVASRTSAFQFKGRSQDLRKVGEALSVRAVLEGSVRTAGKRLRVTARLVGVSDGSTLWAERYDREMEDVFAIQDDISASIVSALRGRLGAGVSQAARRPTGDVDAYQLFLKGQHNWYKRERGSLERAARFFEQAAERDPSYVAALAGVASAYASLSIYGMEPAAAAAKARSAVERAVALDPDQADVRTALGLVSFCCDYDATRAEAELRRAVAINPSHVLALCWIGWVLACSGHADDALASFRRAQELDPLSPYVQAAAGHALMLAGRPREALEQFEKAAEIDADFLLALYGLGGALVSLGRHDEGVNALERAALLAGRASFYLAWLGWGYACSGRTPEASAVLSELEERAKSQYVAPPLCAAIEAALGAHDRAFESLERGYAERNAVMMWLRWPLWSSLENDPRYGDFMKRLRLGA